MASLDAVDRIEARKAGALKSGKFTAAGAVDCGAVCAQRVGASLQARSQRYRIKLQPPDKTGIVGALRCREMREFLREMPVKERNAYVSRRRENMDPDLALAIVEMLAEFSGALGSDRNDLIDSALQAQHGETMTQLKELEHAIEVAEIAVETGSGRSFAGCPGLRMASLGRCWQRRVGALINFGV